MTTQIQRRTLLKLCGAAIAGSRGVTPATATTEGRTEASTSQKTIRKTITAAYLPEESIIRYTVAFDIPEPVTELRAAYDSLNYLDFRTVTGTTNLERREIDGEKPFVWTGGENPEIVFEDSVDTESFMEASWVYHTETEAFTLAVPDGAVRWGEEDGKDVEWGGGAYTVDGDGFATPDMAYFGPHQTTAETVDGEEITIVVPDAANISTDASEVLAMLAEAQRAIGETRLTHDEKGMFVLPAKYGELSGQAIGGSVVVTDEAFQIDSIDNVPAHEFAHTVFGVFGGGETLWLTEAVAEYYGNLVSFNHGVGDFESFYEELQADSAYTDAVLSDERTVRRTVADYSKGPHVLAALDAELQRRTAGSVTLRDVIQLGSGAADNYLGDYENVRDLVITFTRDETMGEWLDEYVKTEALPEIPQDPELFEFDARFTVTDTTFGDERIAPGDQLGGVVRVKNRGEKTGTATVELHIGDDTVRTTEVELDAGGSQVLAFENIETDDLDTGTYTLSIYIDGVEGSTEEVTVTRPAAFELTGIDPETITARPGDTVSLTVDIENVGEGNGTVDVKLFVGETTGLGGPVDSKEVTLESGESGTVEFESVRTSSLDPGEHPVRVEAGDDVIEATLNLVEATPTPAPTATPAETATRTDTATETSTDGSGPGFGVGTVLTSIGGAGYLLKQRLADDQEE